MPTVSVIIVSYNVRHYVEQCLNSVMRSVPDAQLIVVDNCSKDGSVDYLKQRFPDARIIANHENAGFGRANNMALSMVQGRYVLFLNPDTVVAEKTIPRCIEYMDSHPQTGAVGVKMMYADGCFAPESRRSLPTPSVAFWHMTGIGRIFPKSRVFAKYHLSYEDPDKECPIDIVSGAYMFVRKNALDVTGGFDESFFMYGEDIDLSYRIKIAGYQNIYLPVPIIHYKGESTVKTSYNYAKVFYDAMLIFFNKHFRRSARIIAPLVRLVVGIKKIGTFMAENLFRHRRNATGRRVKCLFLGREESFRQALPLFGNSSVLSFPALMPCTDSIPNNLELDGIETIVFDTGVFTYDTILEWLYILYGKGHRITAGFYSPDSGRLITDIEVL
ncbi:MAG: glycosyltransferase family 2 protein [Bacteroidaceae bacterium]|nr:glycosyltransferase family 2 protein [Bacteroidaceae bacterium]